MANGKRDDITLSFSPKSFIDGLKVLSSGLNKFTNNIMAKAPKIGQGLFNAVKPVAKEADNIKNSAKDVEKGTFGALLKFELLKNTILGAFNFLKDQVNQFIPEVGQVFGVVREIVVKNLLFPLRKEILPLLQSMLDWVRDNRATFAKWGGVLVTLFRFVKQSVKTVISIVWDFFSGFRKTVENTFGLTTKTISETLNVFIFKMTSVMVFLETAFKPAIQTIGEVFGVLVNAIQRFSKAATSSFMDTFDVFGEGSGIVDTFSDTLMLFKDAINELMPLIETFGSIVGRVFGVVVSRAVTGVNILLRSLGSLFKLVKNPADYKTIFSDFKEGVAGDIGKLIGVVGKAGSGIIGDVKNLFGVKSKELNDAMNRKPDGQPVGINAGDSGKENPFRLPTQKVNDAIITKTRVIETSPQDTIVATKNPISMAGIFPKKSSNQGKEVRVEINVGGISVTTSAEDSRDVGEGIIEGMREKIRSIFLDDLILQGDSP